MHLRVKEYHLLSLAEAAAQLGDFEAVEQDCREAESFAANDSTMKLAVQSVLANITEK